MKWLRRILISLLVLILIISGGVYWWLKQSAPVYEGELNLTGLNATVSCYFDDFGIPHIYASSKPDVYMAFGYIHAQERLFQMEMLRRAGSGRLAEIIGKPMLKIDRMFLSLGLREYAIESAAYFESQKGTAMYDEVQAYLRGINLFISQGPTPPEFSIIGIEKRPFSVEDLYYISGAMSFSFSQAQKTEPVIDFIHKNYGNQYLKDMGLWHQGNESYIPIHHATEDSVTRAKARGASAMNVRSTEHNSPVLALARVFREVENIMPMQLLQGSNSWVVSGKKTESGEVIFCNDTHIGYMLPQTWYEAHLETPEFSIYGHFMAGIPFALVGRNNQLSWGLTMLLNDDMDFYHETKHPTDPDLFLFEGQYEKSSIREYQIKIKGEQDTTIQVRVTRHGPVINDAFEGMDQEKPISMFWTYTKLPNRNIDAFYGMNNAVNMAAFETNLEKIHAPGLSVSYGDKLGNVAWWGCASLMERAADLNSWTMLDGSKSAQECKGFYPFEKNPRCINPPQGFIYSANDWPQDLNALQNKDSASGELWYPGYYKPQYRADRIQKLLNQSNDWTLDKMKTVMTDHVSDADSALMQIWYAAIKDHPELMNNSELQEYLQLMNWNGSYDPLNPSPVLFNRMLYLYLHGAMADELGPERFRILLETHQIQRTQLILAKQDSSIWWDNITTTQKESKNDILYQAYKQSIKALQEEFGPNFKLWNWKKCLSLELKHPLGEVALFKPFFNIGPYPVHGGNETILQSGFKLDSSGHYNAFFGSQMRIMVDFAHTDSALNITPSGQSGHLMSKHYQDQASLYRKMEFRLQTMNEVQIKKGRLLKLSPVLK
jgi:penicillin G amidase